MWPIVLSGLLATSIGADGVSTHLALAQRGTREVVLPRNEWVRDSIFVVEGVVGAVGVKELWDTGHKRQAVFWTAVGVAMHGAAAVHNLHVAEDARRRQR